MSEKPHRRLIVWQRAMNLIETIYRLTERFPKEEPFGLVAQLRRAAVSVASNIAEGAARHTAKEQAQFFYIARGSISELDTQIEISYRPRFLNGEQRQETVDDLNEVGRLLSGLIASKRGL